MPYIPFILKCFQVHELPRHSFIRQNRLVLLQQSIADFGVVGLRYGIFQVCFLKFIQGDDYAEYFGKRILKVSFGSGLCELYFLYVRIRLDREVGEGLIPHRD